MSKPVYFVQECPTCGRSLQVRVEYLGRQVACQHCTGRFLASGPDSTVTVSSDSGAGLMKRADELLEQAERRKAAWN